MEQIKIQERKINLISGKKGKIIIITYHGEEDPVMKLDQAVSEYVGTKKHEQFTDINMDNPWIRIVMSEI